MAYKLINQSGTIHDFALKMRWGHNIEGSDRPFAVQFDSLSTQGYNWTVFCQDEVKRGDFIIRNNHNYTRILLYEVVKSERGNYGPFGPTDCYEVTAFQCGWYVRDSRTREIANGYGIKMTQAERVMAWIKNLLQIKT